MNLDHEFGFKYHEYIAYDGNPIFWEAVIPGRENR